tara:strand:- start:409 stop:2124 length:1716 start_codon:yes stop_codon:yes gene_type:complete
MAADNPRHIKEILNNILNFIGDKQFWFEQLVFLKNEDYYSYKINVNKKIEKYTEELNSEYSNKEEIAKNLKKLKITKYKLDEYKLDELDKDEGIRMISDDGEGVETEDEYKPSPIFERHYEMLDNTKIHEFLKEEHEKFKYTGTDGLMKKIIDYTKTIEGEIPEVFNFQERLKLVLCGFCHVETIEIKNEFTLDINDALQASRAIKDIRNTKIFEQTDGVDDAEGTTSDGSNLVNDRDEINQEIKSIEDEVKRSSSLISKTLLSDNSGVVATRARSNNPTTRTRGGSGVSSVNNNEPNYLKEEANTNELIKVISNFNIIEESENINDINTLLDFIQRIEKIYKKLNGLVYKTEENGDGKKIPDKIIQFRTRLVKEIQQGLTANSYLDRDSAANKLKTYNDDTIKKLFDLFKTDDLKHIIGEYFYKIISDNKKENIKKSLNEYMKKNLKFIENQAKLKKIKVEIQAAEKAATNRSREETLINFFDSSKKRKAPNLRMLIYFVYCIVVKNVLSNVEGDSINMDEVLKLIENNTYIEFEEEKELFKHILGDGEDDEKKLNKIKFAYLLQNMRYF